MKLTFEMKSIALPGNTIEDMQKRMANGGAMAFADPRDIHPRTGEFVEDVAVINELGATATADSPAIPARPALKTMMRKSKKYFIDMMTQLFRAWLNGKQTLPEIERRVGKTLMERLRTSIREWKRPANAPMTRRRKKFNNPLVETGKLIRSIKWRSVRSRTGFNT
jgi:hypothetical protein